MLDATGIAEACGNAKAANMVMRRGDRRRSDRVQPGMYGRIARPEAPEKLLPVNRKALRAGCDYVRGAGGEKE